MPASRARWGLPRFGTLFGTAFVASLLVVSPTPAQVGPDPEVSSNFIQDQIWTATWRVLKQQLDGFVAQRSDSSISELLAAEHAVGAREIGLYLRYTTNYTFDDVSTTRVVYRYPHYGNEAIDADLERLCRAGLLEFGNDEGVFRSTSLGRRIRTAYWLRRRAQSEHLPAAALVELTVISATLKKVSRAAIDLDDPFPNESIAARRQSWTDANTNNSLVLSQEYYADYTAFNNDNAHYRFDRIEGLARIPVRLQSRPSPLAKELMATMRNQRTYSIDRCSAQANWRQPRAVCEAAFDQLHALGLVTVNNGSYAQSELGVAYFSFAQERAERRFYVPWQVLTAAEYDRYKRALHQLSELLQEPDPSRARAHD